MYEIKFYRTDKPYGCFSNFSKHPIQLDGKIWPSSEHYFQAQKFAGHPDMEEIRLTEKAIDAARMGRERHRPFRSDWDMVKDDIMRTAVRSKIQQHDKVRSILLSTGNCILIEHTTNDSYWADAGNGTGKNMLGEILMEIRNVLPNYDSQFFIPQWLKHPQIGPLDMFWRMGSGENYVMQLAEWFYAQPAEAQKEWEAYFPPPKEWSE